MTTVKVTQADIDHGKAGDCLECPVALAICRYLRAHCYCKVWCDTIYIMRAQSSWPNPTLAPKGWYAAHEIPTPEEVRLFIGEFDAQGEEGPTFCQYGPFEFELAIPSWALKEAA